jgi:3'-phosphoadenosine 5'-phosphosulfate sulfotransferase (PAPS reductase)/FAD synthetase
MSLLVNSALAILDEAILRHQPSQLFALFSGGYDSLCATYVTSLHPLFSGVLHINTRIGIPKTHEFVYATCKAFGWPLLEYRSPITYEETILTEGFPGPAAHPIIYVKLKERAIAAFMRDHKRHWHDRIMLSTGARKDESRWRMGHVQAIRLDKTRVWVNPIMNWSKSDVLDYIAAQGLPHNEVVDLLHLSGECLCGCFGSPEELAMIDVFYPEVGAYIHSLEERVRAAGIPACKWGQPPPAYWKLMKQGQISLPGFDPTFLPLCTTCDARFAAAQAAAGEQPTGTQASLIVPETLQPVPHRIWTFPVKDRKDPAATRDAVTLQQIEHPLLRLTDDASEIWRPDNMDLLARICKEEEVPFDLVKELLRLEQRGQYRKDHTDIQESIFQLLSGDWSASGVTKESEEQQEQTPTPSISATRSRSLEKPKQLSLW